MRLLKNILFRTRIQEVVGSTNVAVEHIAMDSRHVKPFSLFVAVSGTVVDGHDYISKAIESGATAIVCERLPENKDTNITYIRVTSSAESLGFIAANYYDNPSEKIDIVAVTGTHSRQAVGPDD